MRSEHLEKGRPQVKTWLQELPASLWHLWTAEYSVGQQADKWIQGCSVHVAKPQTPEQWSIIKNSCSKRTVTRENIYFFYKEQQAKLNRNSLETIALLLRSAKSVINLVTNTNRDSRPQSFPTGWIFMQENIYVPVSNRFVCTLTSFSLSRKGSLWFHFINEEKIHGWKLSTGTVSEWMSVFVHVHESRRPVTQLWSSFLTLLSSLAWAFVKAGAADSAASTEGASFSLVLDSISSSESSSSFSLSISSSACLFSSLRLWEKGEEEKGHVTQHIFRDKQPLFSSVAESQEAWTASVLSSHGTTILTFQFQVLTTDRWFSEAIQQNTNLVSVTEMSRDCTNIEQRKEAEGRTWAGVCRS